jgi:two-component system chemotaxis response regulator CheY
MSQTATVNVLVVDDYPNMRMMMKNMLRQIGLRDIYTAEDGNSAVQELAQRSYRLIVSDWNMSPMSGLQLLRHVRETSGLHNIPFVMVTGNEEAATKASEIGAEAVLVKPFSAADLKEAIGRALAARR